MNDKISVRKEVRSDLEVIKRFLGSMAMEAENLELDTDYEWMK